MTTFIDQHDKFMKEIKMGNTRDAFQTLQKYPKIAVSNIHVYNFCWSINCNDKKDIDFYFLNDNFSIISMHGHIFSLNLLNL